jgi:L-alanine-DL-glutamate epimerase-like enolase superfamily enzyme
MILDGLATFRFSYKNWEIVDLRIDLPKFGPGSDAINNHTQYSNPVAICKRDGLEGIGAGFTLGLGNDLVCKAIDDILNMWDGYSLKEIAGQTKTSVYDVLANPQQIRWLSPNSGVNYQAVGVIVNTIVDLLSKEFGKPAWEAFTLINETECSRFYDDLVNLSFVDSLEFLFDNPCFTLRDFNKPCLPIYHTTWIGSSSDALVSEIEQEYRNKGVTIFKIKIGRNIESFLTKIVEVKKQLPNSIRLCVDANQTLTLAAAKKFVMSAEDLGLLWLEEPFAPDNILAFQCLIEYCKQNRLSIEIVTGENCPSPHMAAALMAIGINRFQADPCRMLGFVDVVLISLLSRHYGVPITPHAGGSCLDELSAHISFFDRVSNNYSIELGLLEHVGFCSKFMLAPVIVSGGKISAPQEPGLLVGFTGDVRSKFKKYKDGITWLKP